MFLGTHNPRLDDKGRLILPAKFREQLEGGLVITRGQERCLFIWAMPDWLRLTEAMRQAPVTNKAARDYQRMFFAAASDEVPDRQGRITVPPLLRQYAGLQRDCVVIGANDRLEVWDAQAWATYTDAQEPAFADRDDRADHEDRGREVPWPG